MYELLSERLGTITVDDAYNCFLAAANHKVDKERTNQRELAEKAGCTPQHLNAVLKGREEGGKQRKASMQLQQAIADYYGYTLVQFLELGQQVIENVAPADRPERQLKSEPELEERYDMSIPLIGEELDYIHQLTKTMQKLHAVGNWWKSVFDAVPTPLIVLKADKTVIYNNRRNQQLFAKTKLGMNLCEACHSDMDLAHPCTEDDEDTDCPIDKVARYGGTADIDVWIKGNYYSVNAATFTSGGETFIFVATIPINKIARAEAKIKTISQEIYWLMHDHPWPILFADADKNVKYYNRRFQRFFNISENHLKRSEDFWVLCSERLKNPAEVIAESKRCRAEQIEGTVEIEMLNGTRAWIIFTPAFGHHGEFMGIQAKVLDDDEYTYYKHCLGGSDGD